MAKSYESAGNGEPIGVLNLRMPDKISCQRASHTDRSELANIYETAEYDVPAGAQDRQMPDKTISQTGSRADHSELAYVYEADSTLTADPPKPTSNKT